MFGWTAKPCMRIPMLANSESFIAHFVTILSLRGTDPVVSTAQNKPHTG